MKGLESVLKEELGRLLVLEKSYVREIKKLPKGCLRHKCMKGRSYAYLVFRQGARIIHRYRGKSVSPDLDKLKAAIEQRRKYEKMLREVRVNIKRLERIICGQKRTA